MSPFSSLTFCHQHSSQSDSSQMDLWGVWGNTSKRAYTTLWEPRCPPAAPIPDAGPGLSLTHQAPACSASANGPSWSGFPHTFTANPFVSVRSLPKSHLLEASVLHADFLKARLGPSHPHFHFLLVLCPWI